MYGAFDADTAIPSTTLATLFSNLPPSNAHNSTEYYDTFSNAVTKGTPVTLLGFTEYSDDDK